MISIRVDVANLQKIRANLAKGLTDADGSSMVNAFEAGIIGSGNYSREWVAGQGDWKPLDPEYRQEKIDAGLSPQIWKLTGETLKALSTPAFVVGRSAAVGGRVITVMVNKGYFVEVGWKVTSPAASGWPGNRTPVTVFPLVNSSRPFIQRIGPEAIAMTQQRLNNIISEYFKRIFDRK